jgi:hypothetical protein
MLVKLSESTAARRTVYFTAVNTADDTAYTSTLSGADIKISKAGGSEANSAGTATHIATGLFKYTFTTGEIDTLGEVSMRLAKTGVYNDIRVINVVAFDPYASSNMGMSLLDTAISSRLESTAYQDISAMLDVADTIETGVTLRQALRLLCALGGRTSGAGTGTEYLRAAVSNSKVRITATVDSVGNRTGMSYDLD